MIEINAFITSLKVTWLRRLILSSETGDWKVQADINVGKLVSLAVRDTTSVS